MKKSKNICVCVSDLKIYSETFIKAHIDYLPGEVVYKSMLPLQLDEDSLQNKNTTSLSGKFKTFLKKRYAHFVNANKQKSIANLFKEKSIGIVLAEYGHIGVAVMETCKKNNIPLVVHFHGFDAYKKDTLKKFEKQYQEMFQYAKAIIVVSRDMEKQLLRLGAPANKMHYNVYGVDITKFKKSDNLNSPKTFLFVGRFVEKKAPYLAIMAFKKALESVPDAKFYMVGDGLLWDVCRNLIQSLHLSEQIILLGPKNHTEVVDLMQTSRAYVQHSIVPESGDSEGTPNSILEAQASGIPVISTKHAGITDVVTHGETGFLVDEGDVDGMAKFMVELLMDNNLAAKMGDKGRENAMRNFKLEDSIAKLKTILTSHIN